MSSCRSLAELHRTMSFTRTTVMFAWFSTLFLDVNRRERLLGKIPDGVDLTALERRFLTALITACNGLDCFLFGIIGKGLRGGRLGIDLKPFEEHELESSKRQSLSILGLSSILKYSVWFRSPSPIPENSIQMLVFMRFSIWLQLFLPNNFISPKDIHKYAEILRADYRIWVLALAFVIVVASQQDHVKNKMG